VAVLDRQLADAHVGAAEGDLEAAADGRAGVAVAQGAEVRGGAEGDVERLAAGEAGAADVARLAERVDAWPPAARARGGARELELAAAAIHPRDRILRADMCKSEDAHGGPVDVTPPVDDRVHGVRGVHGRSSTGRLGQARARRSRPALARLPTHPQAQLLLFLDFRRSEKKSFLLSLSQINKQHLWMVRRLASRLR
jgi:hypothetical protein